MNNVANWICCQLGAREHYAIPRALHQSGQLAHLITDAWVKPDSFIQKLPNNSFKSLGDRHHQDLSTASVHDFTSQLIFFEAKQRLLKTQAWDRMIARNDWFQSQVIGQLKQLNFFPSGRSPVLFTYSYAALEVLRYARSQGWITILGQIDPGIEEEKIVLKEFEKYPDLAPDWRPVPIPYWQNWQQECALADHILVNSHWSKKLLIQSGVTTNKIHVVPLVYQPPQEAENFQRIYPEQFSKDRPLRVLFLGLVTLRKGIAACLEAIAKLEHENIEFWFVGTQQINIPENFKNHSQVHWIGDIPRSETGQYYREADIFLFPTLSDGFGLTQLEAQAWKLPIIASKFCGDVVINEVNGLVLEEINGETIAQALIYLTNHPQKIQEFSQSVKLEDKFSLRELGCSLQNLIS